MHAVRLWTDENSRALSIDIERALHAHCSFSVNKAYSAKARSLIFNLTRNTKLCMQVLQQEIAPSALVLLRPEDMATTQKATQRRQWVKEKVRLQTKKTTDEASKALTSSFTSCPHCGNGTSELWQFRKGHLGDRLAVARKCLRCGGMHGDLP